MLASVGPKTLIVHPPATDDGLDNDGDTVADEANEIEPTVDVIEANPDYFESSILLRCGTGSASATGGTQAGPAGAAPGPAGAQRSGTISGPDTGTGTAPALWTR